MCVEYYWGLVWMCCSGAKTLIGLALKISCLNEPRWGNLTKRKSELKKANNILHKCWFSFEILHRVCWKFDFGVIRNQTFSLLCHLNINWQCSLQLWVHYPMDNWKSKRRASYFMWRYIQQNLMKDILGNSHVEGKWFHQKVCFITNDSVTAQSNRHINQHCEASILAPSVLLWWVTHLNSPRLSALASTLCQHCVLSTVNYERTASGFK